MMPLSQEEIAVVRHSASIGDSMAQAMAEAVRPGVLESEVYAAGAAAAFSRGTVVPTIMLGSGPTTAVAGPPRWSYRAQAPRVIQEGDVVTAEVFSSFGMRHTQHQVAIAVGAVHQDIERAALVSRACYEAGLQTLRAGRWFEEVVEAMLKPVEAAGGWVRGPQIHGMNPYGAISRIPGGLEQVEGAGPYPPVESSLTAW